MYSKIPNLVLGFHGCDKSVADRVIKNGEHLKASHNVYDWLGNGIYFWEQNCSRAIEWAKNRNSIDNPAVVGAVIDLGYCLNTTDYRSSEILKQGYEYLKMMCEMANEPLPSNKPYKGSHDLLLRELDCAVIQHIHNFNEVAGYKPFDSVRGVFEEGGSPYLGSGFKTKTHIQLCIINPNCIKGYFRPLEKDVEYDLP